MARDPRSIEELVALLERHHGLRIDELTQGRLQRALGEEAGGVEAAARRATTDPTLLQRLLDDTTLQESSFFRDPPVFADLATHVLPAAISGAGGARLVVWSAGCANGQEAWSLAMLLTELGAPSFEVVASDVSAAATARAAAGVYDGRELRGLSAARRERFLVRDGARWRVRDELRDRVRVVRHNAATEASPVSGGSCALVLCRYVLIYLTPEAAADLLTRVADALAPGGRLVVGAVESLWYLSERFTPEALPHAVAYRRSHDTDPAAGHVTSYRHAGGGPSAAQRLPPHVLSGDADDHAPDRRSAPTTPRADTGTPVRSPGGAALVREGEVAAAEGDLPAAATAFRGAADLDPDDAVALVQLGLVLDAMADPGAHGAFSQARAAAGRRPAGALAAALGSSGAAALLRLLADKLEE